MAALAVGHAGWNTIVRGADTPIASVTSLVAELQPALTLVASVDRRVALRFLERWRRPKTGVVLAGGAGFREGDMRSPRAGLHLGSYAGLASSVDALCSA